MRQKVWTPLIVAVSVVIGMAIGYFLLRSDSVATQNSADKIGYVLDLIHDEYVDETNGDSLTDMAIRSMLEELDPHSVYLTSEEYRKENAQMQGNFYGIGVQFRISGDSIVVVRTVKDGPSEKAGIMAGDRIVKVNGRRLKNLTDDTVVNTLRGEKGTKVRLTIARKGLTKLTDYTVKRSEIKTTAVDYYGMLTKTLGYIRLAEFTATSHEEVNHALKELKKQGMKDLVFDLRDNGGGYLDQAVKIADEFIAKGSLIVYTQGRFRGRDDSYATSGGEFEKGKLYVMINELSASASEIVSGCIQDNDRGVIYGRRTFGKGLVQEQRLLPDSSAIRLTVAKYYTPSGRCIQRPYIKGDPQQYFDAFVKRFENMADGKDTVVHNDSLRYKTKKGRIVYGGGGIEPDIVLPYNLAKHSQAYSSLIKNGITYKFCYDYLDGERRSFSKYKNAQEMTDRFRIDNALWQRFSSYAAKNGIKMQGITPAEKNQLCTLIKAYIAQNLYGKEAFYKVYTGIDDELQRMLKQISR